MSTINRFLKRLKALAVEPSLLPEYLHWVVQKLMCQSPTRRIHGIRLGNFVNFSEFHSVSRGVSRQERAFFETYDFGEGATIDIGANLGLVSLLLSRRYSDRRFIAIEPAPSTYSALVANVAMNAANIETFQLAISELDGSVSFAALPKARANAFVITGGSSSASAIEVSAQRLDSLVQELRLDQIALIKIDTEGFETAVLRGAPFVLSQIRPRAIYFEVCPELSRRAGFGAAHAAQILVDAGYELYELGKGQTLSSVIPSQAENIVSANWVALLPGDAEYRKTKLPDGTSFL